VAAVGAGSVASAGSVAEIEALCHVRQCLGAAGSYRVPGFVLVAWARCSRLSSGAERILGCRSRAAGPASRSC
jgi:hypothetical protein